MRSLTLAALLLASGTGTADLPVLVVSGDHNTLPVSSRPSHKIYSMKAAPGLVLDASSYRFPSVGDKTVNGIQLARGKALYVDGDLTVAGIPSVYAREWGPGSGTCVLSASTLTPMYGSEAFRPLLSGDVVAVGIGHFAPPGVEGEDFTPIWGGIVEVK